MLNEMDSFPLLSRISSPADLRQYSEHQLPALAVEMREFLLQSTNISGGHLAAGLGTVELTIALHYVFHTPDDALIWDVGHQAYPHKLLTGRRAQLPTIRQTDGLAPFPSRSESIYDCFGVGHSSTSISAALGFSVANHLNQCAHKSIAVIGDGAMTAGMAFEALNHAGDLHANLLVILNDNDMSISHNVGALSNYLTKILSGKIYSHVRAGGKKVLRNVPPMWELAKRTEQHIKGMVVPGTLFEELGFYYLGPIDGHDIPSLLTVLRNMQQQQGPQLLHVTTRKGKGYPPAEQHPIAYHGVTPGFYATSSTTKPPTKPTYSNVFGQWLCDMAAQDPDLVAITPAMREGSDMVAFSEHYPDRYFDVGIAEQHSVTFAAGLACAGKKPVVAIYSTFLQRAYDQLIHDVCLQNLPVLFAVDRAGLVGGDGCTHNGNFDLSFLRCIPNLLIMAPSDENECRQMLYTGFVHGAPAVVRYPRGVGRDVAINPQMTALAIGKAQLSRQGKGIALLAFGSMLSPALAAGETLDATVINMRFVKPLDETLLSELAQHYSLLVTIEENAVAGGAGSAVASYLASQSLSCPLLQLGLPDSFLGHGNVPELLQQIGLDHQGIVHAVQQRLARMHSSRSQPNATQRA